MERLRISFGGTVQGVGFRATARHIAGGFAVTGWVKNEPDMSVSMEVQGAGDQIERFLGELRKRMAPFIRSENSLAVSVVDSESGFQVRR